MNKVEILAPVGSEETLKAAVLSGADAVYFGLGNFNARRNAQNFTDEQIENAIKYCHSRGVKVHITLNTLIKDGELKKVFEVIRKIANIGTDADIVQDLSVVTALASVLSGGLLLGAIFMATDYVTSPETALGKIVYGIGAFSLSNDIGTSIVEADRYIKGYLANYSGVAEFMENAKKSAKEKGYDVNIVHRDIEKD